jgi:Cu(I)-responsive transcriptional regulator
MNIGQAARLSGVSAKMIRHYEASGLIPPAGRTDAGYRDYSDRDVHMLRFVGRARDLGFTMAEIAGLLDLWRDRNRQSADVKQIARARLDDIRRRIAELHAMAATLGHLADCCAGDDRPDCPILDDLASADIPAPRRRQRRQLS